MGEGEVIKVEEECAGVCEGVREISESYNYFPKLVISLSPGHCGETMLSFKNLKISFKKSFKMLSLKNFKKVKYT